MNLGRLASRAKETIDRRGGTESLKQDAEELRDIARSKGSAGQKAKQRRRRGEGSGGARQRAARATRSR